MIAAQTKITQHLHAALGISRASSIEQAEDFKVRGVIHGGGQRIDIPHLACVEQTQQFQLLNRCQQIALDLGNEETQRFPFQAHTGATCPLLQPARHFIAAHRPDLHVHAGALHRLEPRFALITFVDLIGTDDQYIV